MSFQTNRPLSPLESKDCYARFIVSLAIFYCDLDSKTTDYVCNNNARFFFDPVSGGSSVSTIKDKIGAAEWQDGDNGTVPLMRGFRHENLDDAYNTSKLRTRKGVQVQFSPAIFSSPQPHDEGRTKKAAPKARWPYRAKD